MRAEINRPLKLDIENSHDFRRVEPSFCKSLGCTFLRVLKWFLILPHCGRHNVITALPISLLVDESLNKSGQRS